MPQDDLGPNSPLRTGKLSVHPSILQPKGMTSVFREYFHKIFLPFLKRGDGNTFKKTLEKQTEHQQESSPIGARKVGVAGRAFDFFKQGGSPRNLMSSYRMDKLKTLGSEVYKALKNDPHPKDHALHKHYATKCPSVDGDEVSELMAMELAEQEAAKRKKFDPDDEQDVGGRQARRLKKVRRSGLR